MPFAIALAALTLSGRVAWAQGAPSAKQDRGFPSADTAKRAQDEEDFRRAVEAYRFFYPTVSVEAIFNGGREAGISDGKAFLLLSAGPRHLVFTANSDTPYASGAVDLKESGPVVVDLPPGPYIGLVNDHHQRWVLDMGIPGPDEGKGGKYLVLPPGYTGPVPSGYYVGRSDTYKALIALRAMPAKGDFEGAMNALRKVKVYPLSQAPNPTRVMQFVDVTQRKIDSTPLRWEDNLKYWERLHAVLEAEPALVEFRPMYGMLASLGIEKGKPFAPDARRKALLERAAKVGLEEMRVEAFASNRPDRTVWKGRQWEWVGLVPDNADFEGPSFIDLDARDRWFVQAIVASPAMFRRKVGSGSVYFLAARDMNCDYLDGGKTYKLTVPQPVPAKLFWSVTAYDAKTRSQVQTPQDRAALRSLKENFKPNPDGTVDLYFGPKAPPGKEGQWIQTTPGTSYFTYFRVYGPEQAVMDGTWMPADFVPVE
ncbi:DUF1254 domain-containing protein [Myxococcaceae bacterium GXIMD 01537]